MKLDEKQMGNIPVELKRQYLGYGTPLTPDYSVPEIFGWMSPRELLFLYEQAGKMDSVVEIGCWRGRSTHAIATACKGTVYCLDHWEGSIGDFSSNVAKEEDIFSDFQENTKDFSNIKIIKGANADAVSQFDDKSIDMTFIDAGHTYEDVIKDIKNWLPKTKKLICGHDYANTFPDVIKAVDEVFGKPDGVVNSIWYKKL